jgi:hypothetical protein
MIHSFHRRFDENPFHHSDDIVEYTHVGL